MLKPSMQELLRRVGNRYLLVNLTAQRARDLAAQSEKDKIPLPDKAVQIAMEEIARGKIVYRPGPRVASVIPQNNAIAAASLMAIEDAEDSLGLENPEGLEESAEENGGDAENLSEEEEVHRLNEFDNSELDDGDIPEEDR